MKANALSLALALVGLAFVAVAGCTADEDSDPADAAANADARARLDARTGSDGADIHDDAATELDASPTEPDSAPIEPDSATTDFDSATTGPDSAMTEGDSATADPDSGTLEPDASMPEPDAAVADAGPPVGWDHADDCRVLDANDDPETRGILDALTIRFGPDVRTLPIEEVLVAAGAPAVSIAVRRPGEPILAAVYGDSLSGAPLSTDTMFQAGSISKPVWAFSLLTRSDTGSWLDTDVRTALTELVSSHPVTPRQLLTHTSGATVSGFTGYHPGSALPTLREIVLGLPPSNTPTVAFGPAGAYEYSGGGMVTLEWWFATSESMSLPAFVQTSLFGPVGLTRSRYEQPLSPSETSHACGLSVEIVPGECFRVQPETAAAGLWTTPSDLSCLATYLSEERPEVLARARSAAETIPGWPQSMGLGIRYRDLGGGVRLYEHGGINFGFVSWWLFFDDGRSIAVMSNTRTAYSIQIQIVWNLCRGLGWPCSTPGFLPE